MAVNKGQALLKVINKIPMFSNLGQDTVRMILQVCELRQAAADEVLCKFGDQSHEMLVLLSGHLGVFTDEDIEIATIAPVAPVGEMGLITGQPRSATVKVLDSSNLLVVKKLAFDRLMRSDGQACLQVYRNVMQTLWARLLESKEQHVHAEEENNDLIGKLEAIEKEIQALRSGEAR